MYLTPEEWKKGVKRDLDTSKFCRANLLTVEKFKGKITNESYCFECHLEGSYPCEVIRSNGT